MPDRVELSLDEALVIMRVLEETVVSLHRATSRMNGGNLNGDTPLEQYFIQRDPWRRLSEARGILSECLDRQIGQDKMDVLLKGIRYFPDEE